jgi:hypothetical protein
MKEEDPMRRKLIGLAAIAVLATTVTATAVAAAEETKILPEPTATNELITSTGNTVALPVLTITTLGGKGIKCEGAGGAARFSSPNLGISHVILLKCGGPLGSTCTTLGEPAGRVALLGTVHFWLALLVKSGTLVAALVYLMPPFHFTCEALGVKQLILALGCAAAHAEPVNVLTNLTQDVFIEDGVGMPDIRSVLPENATKEIPCILLVQVNEEGAFEEAAQELTLFNKSFEQGAKLISILLMNP